jgi:hypothetical protein
MKKNLYVCTLFFLIGFSIQAHAEFYKWVDENGVTRFSNTGAPKKYKESTSTAEEAKYADQPQHVEPQKENIVIINNIPAPAAVNNSPVASNQKNDLNEKARLERTRLEDLSKRDGSSHYSGRSYTAQQKEAFDRAAAMTKNKVKNDLDLLNKNPEQYFYNKPIEDRQRAEQERNADKAEISDLESKLKRQKNFGN